MSKVNWFVLISVLLVIGYYLLQPLVITRIKMVKSQKLQSFLSSADKLAGMIVPELAVMSGLSNSDRKTEAIKFVTNNLNKEGIDLNSAAISAAVESAYQLYKSAIGSSNKTTTSGPEDK